MGQNTPNTLPDEKPNQNASGTPLEGKDAVMGAALRSVYQKTVDEVVPVDLLDLLGKLD